MSTFMNYTYQSFNFRNRQGARPFCDLLASIAAEEFGHIELASTAINTMLTPAADGAPGESGSLADVKGTRNTQQFIAGGAAALVQDSMGGAGGKVVMPSATSKDDARPRRSLRAMGPRGERGPRRRR
jgi:Mn-containing catalase